MQKHAGNDVATATWRSGSCGVQELGLAGNGKGKYRSNKARVRNPLRRRSLLGTEYGLEGIPSRCCGKEMEGEQNKKPLSTSYW